MSKLWDWLKKLVKRVRRKPKETSDLMGHYMRSFLFAAALAVAFAAPAFSAELTSQQQRGADCETQAGDMRGMERKAFLQQCLSGMPPTAIYCSGGGKRCGNSCIAANEVCHQ